MTRTAPLYTLRWSSQVSRLNNRLGPPTPAPNAVSSASSMSIRILKNLYINLYGTDNNHCFNARHTNNNNKNTENNNSFSSNSSYIMSIENCNQYKSLTNRLNDVGDEAIALFVSLIVGNKFSCLFIVLWVYNFLAVELFTCSPRFAFY